MFGFTEVKLGILPAVISPFVLAKIGRSAARELFLTGARFSAARAREIGLVHAVVPAAELDDDGRRLRAGDSRGGTARRSPTAKALIADVWDQPLDGRRADDRASDRRPAGVAGRPGRAAGVSREAQAQLER